MTIKFRRNKDLLLNPCNLSYSMDSFKKFIYTHISKDDRFAVCFLDISNFKFYNYKFGYEYGDKILRIFFYKVQEAISSNGYVFRYGGNTLVILLNKVDSKNEIENTIRSILNIFNHPVIIEEDILRILINVGISVYPDDSTDIENILKYSEIALNYNKNLNGDKYNFFEHTMYEEIISKGKQEIELINAIYSDEFTVYYQPQIDVRTMKIFGVEALLRWKHPEKGVLLPSYFIDIIEQNGMINEIGKFVFQEACSKIQEWHRLGFNDLTMSINISEKQFQDDSFLDFIKKTLWKTQVHPKYINIEITERILVNPTESILKILHELRGIGVKILIDDFGTKYSSLNYLYCFPVDGIKLDKSFIDRIHYSEKELIIIKNIVNLAYELNLEVIAEGVEQNEQLQKLKNMNCLKIQGFIFGKPTDSNDFVNFLKKFK